MTRTKFGAALALIAAATLAAGPSTLAQSPKHGPSRGEWITWGGDDAFTRYSPLDQINAANVGQLEVAWRWKALSLGTRQETNYKATPLMVDGVLYTPTGVHQVAAIDPETGETLWIFTPPKYDNPGRGLGLGSRALAYWTDGREARLFHNTLDGRLLSIDAKTGKADLGFGDNGQIFLRKGLMTDNSDAPYVGSSSPATVVGNIVVAQVVGDITAPRKEATPGHIRGYDVRTGKQVWKFNTIPQRGEFGNDTWAGDSATFTGNTGVWTMMSADPELGYIYLPVESESNDFYGGHRLGDNLFGESIVALNAKTGKRVWHYQIVHHGLWDYDPPAAPILHDVVVNGKRIKAVTQLTKQGMAFVFDRKTGKPIWPIEERAVPASTAPGEKASPTQPFPTRPGPYSTLGYDEADLIDFTPELKRQAQDIAARYVKGPIYTPPTRQVAGGTRGTWVYPSQAGGSNWTGGAFDPELGLMFAPTRNIVQIASLGEADPRLTNWAFTRPNTITVEGPQGLPILRPPWSIVTATDMNKGEHIWRRSVGGAPDSVRNHPALKGLNLDFDNMGQVGARPGVLVTKTLMFMGEAGNLGGDPGGPMFRAYDKRTGKTVSEFTLPSKATGAPMTYRHKGQQYIVVAVSTAQHPAELVALALPNPGRRKAAPTATTAATTLPTRPRISLTPEEIAAGRASYARSCAVCHGADGEGNPGIGPDLRGLTDLDQITRIVRLGGVEMPAMGTTLQTAEIDLVSKYVAGRLGKNP